MTYDIKLTGPLFETSATAETQRARDDVVRELTEKGQEHLTSAFPTGVPVRTGNYRRNITPVIDGPRGRLHDNDVIYGPWLEGTGSRNQTTRFKGYATFRRTRDWLDSQAQGVCEKHGAQLAERLGGKG